MRIKVFNKSFAKGISFACAILIMAMTVFAGASLNASAATTSIVLDNGSSVAVGNTINVTVNSSAGGTVSVKFSSDKLEYVKCSVSGASCNSNVVSFSGRSGKITFKAISAGKANIIVSCTAADGTSAQLTVTDGSGSTGTSTSTNTDTSGNTGVTSSTTSSDEKDKANENQSQVADAATEVDDSYKSGTVDASGKIMINNTEYEVNEKFTEAQIFRNFYEAKATVGGKEVKAINNNARTMLYLKPKNGGESKFYFYDEAAGTVELPKYLGNADYYVLLSTREFTKEELPSSRFMSTNKKAEFGDYTVYTFSGSEFFYVYGYDALGNEGWYTYDTKTARMGRADTIPMALLERQIDALTSTYDPAEVYKVKVARLQRFVVFLAILGIILLVILVNIIVRKGGFRGAFAKEEGGESNYRFKAPKLFSRDDEDDDDEEEDDEEDEDEEPVKAKKSKKDKKEKRSIFRRGEDDFDIFADMDDDEDDEEEPEPEKPSAATIAKPEYIKTETVKPEKNVIEEIKAEVKKPHNDVEEDLLIPDIASFMMAPEVKEEKKSEPKVEVKPEIKPEAKKETKAEPEFDFSEAIISAAMKEVESTPVSKTTVKVDPVATGAPGSKTSVIDLNNL